MRYFFSKVGSSETTRHTCNYDSFYSWLVGLIDGDGSLFTRSFSTNRTRQLIRVIDQLLEQVNIQ